MKIAISGKGGVGKTTIAGTLSRFIGREGRRVLAIDGDPNPNLSVILGTPAGDMPLLGGGLLERVEDADGTRRIQLAATVDEILRQYGMEGPDNVNLLMVGKPEQAGTGCMCTAHAVVREVVHAVMSDSDQVTVLDMEASLEHMKRGTTRYVDALYIVMEPYYRSLEAGSRIHELAGQLGISRIAAIANKVRSAQDEAAIREFCRRIDLPVAAIIPYDETLMEAERDGLNPLDLSDRSPAVQRIAAFAAELTRAV